MNKKCSKCKETKHLTEFHKNKGGKYGVHSQCKSCKNGYFRDYRSDNLDRLKEYSRVHFQNNKKAKYEYTRKKYENDTLFNIKSKIRSLISQAFRKKGYKKSTKTYKIIGCSFSELEQHLTSTFRDNYGIDVSESDEEVHIDHIIPLHVAKSEEDVILLNHYSNLQYLKATDNLKKSGKLDWELEINEATEEN